MPPKTSAKTSAEEKLQYILTVLSHTELPQPDYHVVSKTTGQSSANNAQKKFKAFIEQAGFGLVDRQIIRKGDGADNEKGAGSNDTTTNTPSPKPSNSRKRSSATKSTAKKPAARRNVRQPSTESNEGVQAPANKKRKIEAIIELSDDEEIEENGAGEVAKQENRGEATEYADDVKSEGETDEEEADFEAERERLRGRRARSKTVRPNDFA